MKKVLTVLLIAAAALAGCSASPVTTKPVAKIAVPDFTLPDLSGNQVTLSSFKGKSPVLLTFWATWCPYCIEEMPNLVRLQKKYGDKIKILAIDIQEPRARVISFARNRNIDLTILLDEEGDVSAAFGLVGVPTLVLIDKEGMGVLADSGLSAEMLASIEALVS